MNYVASVGCEPVDVVLGYYFFTRHASFDKIILIPENTAVWQSSKTKALKRFLESKSHKHVELFEPPQANSYGRLLLDLKKYIKRGDYINISADSGRFSVAMLMAVKDTKAIAISSHGPIASATIINLNSQRFITRALERLLSAFDYLRLYAAYAKTVTVKSRVVGFLDIKDAVYVDIEGKRVAIVVRNNKAHIFSNHVVKKDNKPGRMRRHSNLSRRLAGKYAIPVYRFGIVSSNDKKQESYEVQVKEFARAYGGIACKDGEYDFLDRRAQEKTSRDTTAERLMSADKSTLIALVGDQAIPIILSHKAQKAEQLYLLCSSGKRVIAERIKTYLSKHSKVLIVDIFSSSNPSLMFDYIQKLVGYHTGELHLNLNSDTGLMSVAAFLAKGRARPSYVYENKVQSFDYCVDKEIVLDIEIKEFLELHGFDLIESKQYSLDAELYKKAIVFIKEIQNTKGDGAHSRSWVSFKQHMQKYKDGEIQIGDANEYATYYEISLAFGTDAKVLAESKIELTSLNPKLGANTNEVLSPDALVLFKGALLTVEAKNNIKKVFETNTASKQLHMAQAFGGHFAKSLIVCAKFGNYKDHHFHNRLEQLLNDDLAKKHLTIAVREEPKGWEKLKRFPPKEANNPRLLFENWGWLKPKQKTFNKIGVLSLEPQNESNILSLV